MAGGAGQSGGQSQGSNFGGGQSGTSQGFGQNNQLASLLRNPNLPSMLQGVNTSGISQQNQQAIQQAYQQAQNSNRMNGLLNSMHMGNPMPQSQMTPQMMQAALAAQSQPGQIMSDGTLQTTPAGGANMAGMNVASPAIAMIGPNGQTLSPGDQGFRMPVGGGQQPIMSMANPMAQPQMTPQMMQAALAAQSQPGQIMSDGTLRVPSQGQGLTMGALQGSGSTGTSSDYGGGGGFSLGASSPYVQNTGGPDVTGSAQGGGYAFDQSGNDGGVGGQAVMQRQSPMGGRPPMLSDFRNRQGMQVQGNPSSQPVQRGIGSFGMGRRQQR